MIKIYIHNKPLFLTDKLTEELEDYLHQSETIFLDVCTPASIKTMLMKMEKPEFYQGVFLHNDVQVLLQAFKKQVNVIAAAGGLVHTSQNELLLIHRLGKWDLPKGKLDEGETLEACALREISEETGVEGLSVEASLPTTYHTYYQNGKNTLKKSHWYLLGASSKATLVPQTEENIEQCIWVPLSEIQPYIDGAFPSIADVLRAGIEILQSKAK